MNLFDFSFQSIDGQDFDLSQLNHKKILVVNTASACGYTPQFAQLQELYENTDCSSFEIIGFPSNDFGAQDPGTNAEIAQFCQRNYGVDFPMMAKVGVIGDNADSFFKWLTAETGQAPQWNFHKYLIDNTGAVVKSLPSAVSPLDEEIMNWITHE